MYTLINIQTIKSVKGYLMNATYGLNRIGEGAQSGDVIIIHRYAGDAKLGMSMARSKLLRISAPQITSIVRLLKTASDHIDAALDELKKQDQSMIKLHVSNAQRDFDRAVQYLYVLDSHLRRGSKS